MTDTKTAEWRNVAGSQTTYALTGKKEVTFERTYDATPSQVFAAFTDPVRVASWWASSGATLEAKAMEARTGGTWHFIETDTKGKKSHFHGEYQEVNAPTRLTMTMCYGKGAASKLFAIEETYEFIAVGHQTMLRLTSKYPMGMAMKGMLSVGMDEPGKFTDGSRHQWRLDRLAKVVSP